MNKKTVHQPKKTKENKLPRENPGFRQSEIKIVSKISLDPSQIHKVQPVSELQLHQWRLKCQENSQAVFQYANKL